MKAIKMGILAAAVLSAFASIQPAGAAGPTPSIKWFSTGAFTSPLDVSADGSVIVGCSRSPHTSLNEAFRWTAGGYTFLGDLPGGEYFSVAHGVSADGSIVVGCSEGNGGNVDHPFKWTASTGMVDMGDASGLGMFGYATSISADGSVIAGYSFQSGAYDEATRWKAGVKLLLTPGVSSQAYGISSDGSTIVGEYSSCYTPFRWTQAGGLQLLGDLPGGGTFGYANAASADGSVVVGKSTSLHGEEAFRWTAAGGMVGLGSLPGNYFGSEAMAVSADGSIVLGEYEDSNGWYEAFIWDASHGMRRLADVLTNTYGLDLGGATLDCASAISDDGHTIVGWSGAQGWVAVIPEPATLSLLALGARALIRRRRG